MAEQPSPSSKASLSPGDHLGPYRIVGLLEEGGMGVVYRAHDPRLGRDVALKIMRWPSATPEQIARFGREARAAGSLNHPNIVAVYDVGAEGGIPYVVTELLDGETLRDRLRRGSLSYNKAVDYGGQIARALDAAHRKGILHRDVKPSNVFITKDGHVKLLDFGIAKLSDPDPHGSAEAVTAESTETKGVRGTPGYMSPEQVLGEHVDHRTDIFALGSVLYEMLTGARAFQRPSTVETMNAVLRSDPIDPLRLKTDLPPMAAAVVRRCLEKSKEDRFQSARDLAFQLQQLKDPTTGGFTPVPAPASRRRWWLIAVTTAGLAALAMVLWQFRPALPQQSFERLTFGQGRIGGARFTSDGAAVLYSLAGQGPALQISRLDVADRLSSRLLGDDSGIDLLAVRAGDLALLLQPHFVQNERFVGTLAIARQGGAPRETGKNAESADWSPTGDLAAVFSTGSISGETWIEYPSGHEIYRTKNTISFLRVSPDGERLAFLEDLGDHRGPSGHVAVVDKSKSDGKAIALTENWESARGLAWSPNGKEIWFAASDDEKRNRALRAVTLDRRQRFVYEAPGALTLWDIAQDGRVLVTLDEERRAVAARTPGDDVESDLSWLDQTGVAAISRDGRTLLGGDRFGVFTRATDGSQPTHLPGLGGDAFADDLAADGKTVLATMDERRKLVVLRQGASTPDLLPAGGVLSYSGAYWFPDPEPRRVLFNGKRAGENLRSYVQDVNGGTPPKAITPDGSYGVAISPDGKWIASPAKEHAITLWPVAGGAEKKVAAQDGDRPVAFSEDGNFLWLIRRGEIPAKVYTLDITSGRRELWRTLKPPDPAGVYSIIEFAITPNGKVYAYSYARLLSQLYLARGLK